MSGNARTSPRETAPQTARTRCWHGPGGQEVLAPALENGLYLVATPIGNLRDMTWRGLDVLAAADLIACEDTRVTRKLLDHYGITRPVTAYHEHNAAQARPLLLARLAMGNALALVSDAGTPLISDPGYKLVRAAQEAGHRVTSVPGASALLAALGVAGLPTDRFWFEGFLPPREAARRARISELSRIPATLVLFETGPRLAACLSNLAAVLGTREAAICRELTKIYEEVRRGDLPALARSYAETLPPRGEIAIVIAPPAPDAAPGPEEIDALLQAALARVSVKDAVSETAEITGLPRREIYRRALALSKGPAR